MPRAPCRCGTGSAAAAGELAMTPAPTALKHWFSPPAHRTTLKLKISPIHEVTACTTRGAYTRAGLWPRVEKSSAVSRRQCLRQSLHIAALEREDRKMHDR